jgi:uncharacterized protein (DUF362 family)
MGSQPRARREFLRLTAGAAVGTAAGLGPALASPRPAVGIARIRSGNVARAVEEVIELIGGIRAVTQGRDRIMLKPNLVADDPTFTTKPEVVRALAALMARAHKEVSIGEGSAAGSTFNVREGTLYHTSKRDLLDGLQRRVFERLGYADLAASLRVPLINLHTGDLVEVKVPGGGFVFEQLTLHRSLREVDLLCSVPMMKTHVFAQVTLGMKNLVGLFPGQVYEAPRRAMHETAARVEPSGTAAAVVDMVRTNPPGLVVVDGSMAMEGDGPSDGTVVPMGVIVAGTNPLATDMVAASLMGFDPDEIPTFAWAHKAGMTPRRLDEIEVRGARPESVRRRFVRPRVRSWAEVAPVWAAQEI